jgi:hypothetical protein
MIATQQQSDTEHEPRPGHPSGGALPVVVNYREQARRIDTGARSDRRAAVVPPPLAQPISHTLPIHRGRNPRPRPGQRYRPSVTNCDATTRTVLMLLLD